MQSTVKKARVSPDKEGRRIIREGVDEESRKYFLEIDSSSWENSKMQEYVALEDIPLEVRRREARKTLYLTRYE